MEFSVDRSALLWEAPRNCKRSDIDAFITAMDTILSNIEEMETLDVDLHGVALEDHENVLVLAQELAMRFGLRVRKFFRVEGRIYVNEFNGQAAL